jgi:hypothetical protein
MIYIRIELWPMGNRSIAKCLAEGVIANDGTGTPTRGNYRALFSKRGGFKGDLASGRVKNTLRVSELVGFNRKREGVWDLLRYCLVIAFHRAVAK